MHDENKTILDYLWAFSQCCPKRFIGTMNMRLL